MAESAVQQKRKIKASYFRKGVFLAVMSGVCYGLYTGFLTLGETQGVWAEWFGETSALDAFTITFVLAALASALNDTISGIWSVANVALHGEFSDFWKTFKTKPGRVMMLCAIVGGPVASTAYVIALNMAVAAGSPGIIVPVAALNVAIGAILGRLLFKQELSGRMVVGILICLAAATVMGGTSFANVGPAGLVACLVALVAAFGWGFEGCVAGFGTTLIDYNIGITIRQITAGLSELIILVPLMCLLGGNIGQFPALLGAAVSSPAIFIFLISGFFSMPAFSLWYKGNSMCGAALGMACNGMYSFWGPFFIWVIMGLLNIGGMSDFYPPLTAVQWVAAIVMAFGILVIAMNPMDLFKKKEEVA